MLLVAIGVTSAQAANPHFVTGFAPPTCTVTGTTVTCTGSEIAGVGNNNAVATLSVVAPGIVDCNQTRRPGSPGGNKCRQMAGAGNQGIQPP